MRFTPFLAFVLSMATSVAHAAGDVLIIGNSGYSTLDSLLGTARIVEPAEDFRDMGFDVTVAADADAIAMQEAFATFLDRIESEDAPVIVMLAGVFMHSHSGAFMLGVEEGAPDVAAVLTRALPLDAVLTVLAQRPGRALLLLSESPGDDTLEPYLKAGLGSLEIPQGVTVLRGPAADMARFAGSDLIRPGRRTIRDARRWELAAQGFAPDGLVVLRKTDVTERVPETDPALRADDEAWADAREGDTLDAYSDYLSVYPQGRHAPAARQRVAALEAAQDPFRGQRLAEEGLSLNRDARRKIQRDLSLLGHNTRGIDGIFGRGTRAAIGAWQGQSGHEPSTYLNAAQVADLDGQARRRAAELEEQARLERAEQERRDRIAWEAVTGPRDETGLRSYLETYPDGLFAERAAQLLGEIEERRAARAAQQDRRIWQQVESEGTLEAYRRYLSESPQGSFRREAEARIRQITDADEQDRALARAVQQEEALGLNSGARRMAEVRLSQLRLKPGTVDGRFDRDTRRAIRNYQSSRGLDVTGYLNQNTVVRLLAEGILGR